MIEAAAQLDQQAFERVRTERGVRVEDYLATLAAVAGEAVVVASGIDIEDPSLIPGQPVFGHRLNGMLTGDTVNLAEVDPGSVVGVLLGLLTPAPYAVSDFPDLEVLYRAVADNAGTTAWGTVTLSIPADNTPTILPIRAAFEMRPAVEALESRHGLPVAARHQMCAAGLAIALRRVHGAISPPVGVRLALETAFGMAKMAPMSRRAIADQRGRGGAG